MLAVELPPDIESRLDALSQRTGRSRDETIREAIIEHLERLEDVAVADERLAALKHGGETVSLAELMKRHGVDH